MTLNTTLRAAANACLALFPTQPAVIVVVVSITALPSGAAQADMPPHGRPANMAELREFALGASVAGGEQSKQGSVTLEYKFRHRTQFLAHAMGSEYATGEIAINGDVEVSADGAGIGVYHQLKPYLNTHFTLALRNQNADIEDEDLIESGGSRANYTERHTEVEASVLIEHASWQRNNGLQPYVALGVRTTKVETSLQTLNGRQLSTTADRMNSSHAAAGLHWQRNRWSFFTELSLSSLDHERVQAHVGIRFGSLPRSPERK